MFKKIVVPVDPSEVDFAKPALTAAAGLAGQTSGEIRLVAVMPPMNGYVTELLPADYEVGLEDRKSTRLNSSH